MEIIFILHSCISRALLWTEYEVDILGGCLDSLKNMRFPIFHNYKTLLRYAYVKFDFTWFIWSRLSKPHLDVIVISDFGEIKAVATIIKIFFNKGSLYRRQKCKKIPKHSTIENMRISRYVLHNYLKFVSLLRSILYMISVPWCRRVLILTLKEFCTIELHIYMVNVPHFSGTSPIMTALTIPAFY